MGRSISDAPLERAGFVGGCWVVRIRVFCFLALLFVSGCVSSYLTNSKPALVLTASASLDPEKRVISFRLDANLPLSQAHLSYGAEGGRVPLNVALGSREQYAMYDLPVPPAGLTLSPDVDELRYTWTVVDVTGAQATIVGSLSSPLFLRETTIPALAWQSSRVDNVTLYYLPDSPGERDLSQLRQAARDGMARAGQSLDAAPSHDIAVYLIPRIFWQGGVTFGSAIVMISYADRGYTGVAPADYLSHEFAHALTQDWGNFGAIGGMITEGTAVFATGGHYQPDLLDRSAATLVQSPLYIPPSSLRRDFSNLQHEIAYTESGSFVRYMVDQYGLGALRMIFRRPNDWQSIFGKDFDTLTSDWLGYLRALNVSPLELHRWQLKVRFYDVLRRYEERLDPDGRRLPSVPVERWDATLRNALSKPAEGEDNQVCELILISAITDIESASDEGRLSQASAALDKLDEKIAAPTSPDSAMVADVRAIVRGAQSLSQAFLDRDQSGLLRIVDGADFPQFASTILDQTARQPAWLSFRLSPANLVISGETAFLTVAQWNEPIDRSKHLDANGELWVMSLHKRNGQWRFTGRWPASPQVPMAHEK